MSIADDILMETHVSIIESMYRTVNDCVDPILEITNTKEAQGLTFILGKP